jgi:hypothetical protein
MMCSIWISSSLVPVNIHAAYSELVSFFISALEELASSGKLAAGAAGLGVRVVTLAQDLLVNWSWIRQSSR